MNELFSKIQPKLDENRNWDYSNYMTEHFPRRISGMGDDRRASDIQHIILTPSALL